MLSFWDSGYDETHLLHLSATSHNDPVVNGLTNEDPWLTDLPFAPGWQENESSEISFQSCQEHSPELTYPTSAVESRDMSHPPSVNMAHWNADDSLFLQDAEFLNVPLRTFGPEFVDTTSTSYSQWEEPGRCNSHP